MILRGMIALSLAALPAAGLAANNETPIERLMSVNVQSVDAIPPILTPAQRDHYRGVFASIRSGQWAAANALLAEMPDGPLTHYARAELFLAKGSPEADATSLLGLLQMAPELPQAPQLAKLAKTRGASALPELPQERDLRWLGGIPRRTNAATTRGDAIAEEIGPQILSLIKADKSAEAEAILAGQQAALTIEARTEWLQRIAWSYYLNGDDGNARRLAAQAQAGAGEWLVPAHWVAGLAAWRQKNCAAAGTAFDGVASHARDYEMRAAGLFWSARADLACGAPQRIQPKLRTAARMPETFYGLLAGGALGLSLPPREPETAPLNAEWQVLSRYPNIRLAAALAEIGEAAHADKVMKRQARIGPPQDHGALLHLAGRLSLPSAQIWLAQNGPAGLSAPAKARFPIPGWSPQSGWRVDPALIYAHALQESQFRTDVVSRAGAIGMMQIMPGTAQLIARKKGESIEQSQLNLPSVALEYGQSYLEMLRDNPGTQGLLPKIIAAYNAGPGSVQAWNAKVRDGGDPLLFIESIPFAETRGYVATVLRNYWVYHRQQGQNPESLKTMAQGAWPRFPGMNTRTTAQLTPAGGALRAH